MSNNYSLPRMNGDVSMADIEDALEEWGVVIIERALENELVALANLELADAFSHSVPGAGDFCGRLTKRFSSLLARSSAACDLALYGPILGAVESLLKGPELNPRCDCIQLNLTQAIEIDPGEDAQILHRDETMYPGNFPHELMVNVMWTLDDFTLLNGATRLVPKSHRWPKDRVADEREAVSAQTPAGSAVIWLGSTIHGGGANRSNRSRRGLVISYNLGWLAQAERLLLTTPPSVAKTFPEKLQRLIGYQVHRPNLGWIESRDPIEWLEGKTAIDLPAQDHFTVEIQERIAKQKRLRAGACV